MPHVASPHTSSSRVHAQTGARPQSAQASSDAGSVFEGLLDDQGGAAPAPSGHGNAADSSSPDPSRQPPVSGNAPAESNAQSEPTSTVPPGSDADQITGLFTPFASGATNVPTDVPPEKSAKTDGKSASDQTDGGDKQTKKDTAVVTTIAPVLIATAAPQQPAQVAGPTDQPKTTDKADAANPVQAAQTATASAANAIKPALAAATQTESPDATPVDAADPDVATAQGQPQTNTTTAAKAADPDAAGQTPSEASGAGTPVANAVARSRAAPESAVVLPRVTRPLGKGAREKAPADTTKASTPSAGNASEPTGIAAPDPNAAPAAAGSTHPVTGTEHAAPRDPAAQTHHAASGASSSSPADKSAATGDLGLSGTAGAGTAMAASSTNQAAGTPSTPSAPTAPPPPNTPVPLAGIPLAIAGRALAGERHFDIRLDPPELGRIEVRMKVDRDGRITSHLIADRRDTLDLLRQGGTGLERALHDAGLKTAGDGLQFSLRDQSSNTGHDGQRNLAHLIVQDDTAPVRDPIPASYSRLAGRIGGLDIRV